MLFCELDGPLLDVNGPLLDVDGPLLDVDGPVDDRSLRRPSEESKLVSMDSKSSNNEPEGLPGFELLLTGVIAL